MRIHVIAGVIVGAIVGGLLGAGTAIVIAFGCWWPTPGGFWDSFCGDFPLYLDSVIPCGVISALVGGL